MTRRFEILSTAFGVIAFALGVLSYENLIDPDFLLPLDLIALAWLVYDTNPPQLATHYSLPRVASLPFVAVAISLYLGLLNYSYSKWLAYAAILIVLLSFFWTVNFIDTHVDFGKLRGSLKQRLHASRQASAKVDPDYARKNAILFWGLLKIPESRLITLGEVIAFPVLATFLGIVVLVYLMALAENFSPLTLVATPFIVALNLIRLGKGQLRKAKYKPVKFLVDTWSATDKAEQAFSGRLLRLMLKPHALLYFWGFIASVIYALVAVYVFGSFLVITSSMFQQEGALYIISVMILLDFGHLPAFLFIGYLALSLMTLTYRSRTLRMPNHPLLWLGYSIAMLSLFYSGLSLRSLLGLDERTFGTIFLVGPASVGTMLIILALLRPTERIRKQDEWKFASGIIITLLLFSLQAGWDDYFMLAGMAFTILLWYGISQLMSGPLALPLNATQKLGGVCFSAALAASCIFFLARGDWTPGVLSAIGASLVWTYFLPRETINRLARFVGIREEIQD